MKVDTEVEFKNLNVELEAEISKFEPTGIGNPTPVFITKNVSVVDARTVGAEGKHLKLTLEKDDKIFNAIAFGKGEIAPLLSPNKKVGIAYNLSLDTWNGNKSLQLKVKDLKLS
ncbi:MAG: Exonuclease RecJ [Candidatus Woesebacteria bacterium GW2011_GWA1_39_8]|uniref:Exonuclease RecJ n=1 Tax=Candidatus Woesebacteria bacterium GW2011_GWA1_39_8 TaxID=1618552 RepID=A0A0G0PR41_9BACT|nr:MAG: Exonuclease RecJ [Candidatus Woesebacteria bacterium GW2011_GWA1_39_8]